VVFGIVLGREDASDEDYEAVVKAYETAKSADGKEIALAALGDVKRPELVKKTIDFILSGKIPAQDIHGPCHSLATNPVTRNQWWETLSGNWSLFYERYSVNMVVVNRLLTLSLSRFSSKKKADEIAAFFKDKDCKGFDRGLGQVFPFVFECDLPCRLLIW